ncbi:MAG: hypothetical protein ACYTHM_11230 [Planctomycetota bacterium]
MSFGYGVLYELGIGEEVRFDDGLSIRLTSFSHKRPYIGGPTKATAYLHLSKGDDSGELLLSIHGIQGKSSSEDGLSDRERYDKKSWNEYEFQLREFKYDKSIKVIIEKQRPEGGEGS